MAKRSDVRSAPAADLQREAAVRVFVQHLDGVHLRRPRLNLHVDPLPRQIAELLPVPLERRIHRRNLRNFTDKPRQNRFQLRPCRMRALARDNRPVRVLRIGRIAGFELRNVCLFLFDQIIKQPRRAPDHQRQHAGGLRVKCSRVADLHAPAQLAPNANHHVARGHSRRLEHTEKPVHACFSGRGVLSSLSFIAASI